MHDDGKKVINFEDAVDLDFPLYELVNKIGEKEWYYYPTWEHDFFRKKIWKDTLKRLIKDFLGTRELKYVIPGQKRDPR
jgi:hypothetical protein